MGGLPLPSWSEFTTGPWGSDDYRVVFEAQIRVCWDHHGEVFGLSITYHPGSITDFGSVPAPLRGVVDNDEAAMVIPSMIHDALWSTRLIEFEMMNRLFFHSLRYCGMSWWRAALCWLAVSSSYARQRYYMDRPEWVDQGIEIDIITDPLEVLHG
jgi:hypothetical protein